MAAQQLRVNLVTGGRIMPGWIFEDLVQRLQHELEGTVDFNLTSDPLAPGSCDVYHYLRPQAAVPVEDLSNAVLMHHGFGKRGRPPKELYGDDVGAAFKRAGRTVVLNELDRRLTLQRHGVEPRRLVKIPHAVDRDVFTLRPNHDVDQPLVIGRVGQPYGPPDDPDTGEENKGRSTLREIMRHLQHRAGDVEWLFLGHGWEEELDLAVGMGFNVCFWRRGSDVEYPEGYVAAYHRMDVYLVTSRSEGGPASLPEAMSCGVWPLCTPVGMCRDLLAPLVIGDLGRGMLYPINDHHLAVQVLDDLTQPFWRRRLNAARATVAAHGALWNWQLWGAAYLRTYLSVYEGGAA